MLTKTELSEHAIFWWGNIAIFEKLFGYTTRVDSPSKLPLLSAGEFLPSYLSYMILLFSESFLLRVNASLT